MMLQVTCWDEGPEQYEPPEAGVGLLQTLVWFFVPVPHVTEHSVESCHLDQFPSTWKNKILNALSLIIFVNKTNVKIKAENPKNIQNYSNLYSF
jgi:hypothetical protein